MKEKREKRERDVSFWERKKSKKRFQKKKNFLPPHPLQPLSRVREPVAPARAGPEQVLLREHPEAEHVVGDGAPEGERLPVESFFCFLNEWKKTVEIFFFSFRFFSFLAQNFLRKFEGKKTILLQQLT